MNIDHTDILKETGVAEWRESDVKFDESVFDFISGLHEKLEEMYYDAIPGEVLDRELIREARIAEKEPTEECWGNTGKSPVGARWVDANKGDKENPEHRRRLVARR